MLAQQQAQKLAYMQQQIQAQKSDLRGLTDYANDYFYAQTWTTGNTAATNDNIIITGGTVQPAKPVAPVPETNVAWLNRRVNEMRVAL
jgi:hypothetical protein